MKTRTLGRTGLDVSILGFGTAEAAYLKTDRDRAAVVINALLDAGVNVIDTAASYPGSEAFLGEYFSGRRGDYVLVSKCGMKIPESDGAAWSAKLITDSVDRSLRLLRTDRIDVMLLHSCGRDVLEKGEAIAALVAAREAGKIRFVGYSGDNDAAAYAAGLSEVAVIETSISIVDQINIDRVLPVAAAHNVGVIAKRPIGNAAWKPLSDQHGIYQNYAKTYTERFAAMKLSPGQLGFTGDPVEVWPQIAMRFTLSFPQVHTAIIGTTNPDHSRRNLEIADQPALPPDALDKIRAAYRAADPTGAWDGQT